GNERAPDPREGKQRTARFARAAYHDHRRGEADGPGLARQPLSAESDAVGEVVPHRVERRARRRARRGPLAARLVAGPGEAADSDSARLSDRLRPCDFRYDAAAAPSAGARPHALIPRLPWAVP